MQVCKFSAYVYKPLLLSDMMIAHALGRLAGRRVTAYPTLDLQEPLTAFHIQFSMKAFTRCF